VLTCEFFTFTHVISTKYAIASNSTTEIELVVDHNEAIGAHIFFFFDKAHPFVYAIFVY
jgi:hypothetical protein